MKAYEMDRAHIREAAMVAATHSTMEERKEAMEGVWEGCADAAQQYHNPPAVTAMFVKEAVAAFMDSRTTLASIGAYERA
ncbi:hypothetical protein [Streptomyces sp. NPDC059994]|uniref:hypothetical protein n=1 Tax=Streptomyces sp. NPDC059994 TaxID=3347029 RepID=UPI00368E5574